MTQQQSNNYILQLVRDMVLQLSGGMSPSELADELSFHIKLIQDHTKQNQQ